jgi:hypothetical protein
MDEAKLLKAGALRNSCSEPADGFCEACGMTYSSDSADGPDKDCCPYPGHGRFAYFKCFRCEGQFSTQPSGVEHACKCVEQFRATGKIAFEHEAKDELDRLDRDEKKAEEERKRIEGEKLKKEEDRIRVERRKRRKEEEAKRAEEVRKISEKREEEERVERERVERERIEREEREATERSRREEEERGRKEVGASALRKKILIWSVVSLPLIAGVGYGTQFLSWWQLVITAVIVARVLKASTGAYQRVWVSSIVLLSFAVGAEHSWQWMVGQYFSTTAGIKQADLGERQPNGSNVNVMKPKAQATGTTSIPGSAGKLCKTNGDCSHGQFCTVAGSCQNRHEVLENSIATNQAQGAGSSPSTSSPTRSSPILERAEKCADAKSCIASMLEAIEPRSPDALQMATVRLGALNHAQRGDRKNARALNEEGLIEFKKGNSNGATDLLKKASAADPADVEISSNLGYVALRADRLDDAVTGLSNALILDPRRTSTWLPIAELYAKRGKSDNAVRALLLGYEFSGNKEKTISVYEEKIATADREDMRPIYAEAVSRVRRYIDGGKGDIASLIAGKEGLKAPKESGYTFAREGERCSAHHECGGMLACNGAVCVDRKWREDVSSALPPGNAGMPCATNSDCNTGLFCYPISRSCQKVN